MKTNIKCPHCTKEIIKCIHCQKTMFTYANPKPTVDVIIYDKDLGIVIIERKNIPYGFALPGGFIDTGESAEHAAIREMKEETSLDVQLVGLLGVYSDPLRDPRYHTLGIVYVGKATNVKDIYAGDDAKSAEFYALNDLPQGLAFDHAKIIEDFKKYLGKERELLPIATL